MITFFINLDAAEQRRIKFKNTDIRRWRATPRSDVPEYINNTMLSMYNFGNDAHLARCGCWLSHTRLLEYIVENKLDNVLILEDDAIQVNPIPIDYPKDGIIYLGGFMYNRKMIDESQPQVDHQKGINLCPQEYRILGCLSYIIPTWRLAFDILNKIYSQSRFKAIDIMLGNISVKQYYSYPGSFREEGCPSQISEKNKKNKIMTEFYNFKNYNKYNAENKSILKS